MKKPIGYFYGFNLAKQTRRFDQKALSSSFAGGESRGFDVENEGGAVRVTGDLCTRLKDGNLTVGKKSNRRMLNFRNLIAEK